MNPRLTVRHPNRRRRNPGVMLTGRPAAGRCPCVVTGDGGKAKLHRTARRVEDRRWRAEAAAELTG